jgi:outer membrane lipoprotein-sorting protein
MAENVDAILGRMDQAAPGFHALTANVKMDTFTALLSDHTIENGTLQMQRPRPSDVRAIIEFKGSSDARTIAFLGKSVRIYYPKLNTYQDYDLGKNSQVLNQYLLLGFGSSGKELAQSYTITSEGQEKVADRSATKLLLIPKDLKVKEHLSKAEIWVPEDAPYPVQQQFYEPSDMPPGNSRKVTYSDIVLNPELRGTLELKLPPGAKKQQ